MKINKVSIIGLGLIGGSIAKRLKLKNYNIHISAYDDENILSLAYKEKIIDKILSNYFEAIDSDCCFLCAPADISLKFFEEMYPKLKKNSIITDVCGIKTPFAAKAKELKSDGCYIGGHPMTGKERSGYKYSDPYLFENATYILAPNQNKYHYELYESFYDLITLLGARIKFLDPETHDEIVAAISHLPQLLASTLTVSTAVFFNNSNSFEYAGGGFKDMTRIASSDYNIWEPIFKFNKNNILKALNIFKEHLLLVEKNLSNENNNFFSDLFLKAKNFRDKIPKTGKGFLNPLSDIIISAKDEPGTLFNIFYELYRSNLDIKDIELLKIREKIDGVFRISFLTKEEAEKAVEVLNKAGFETKLLS